MITLKLIRKIGKILRGGAGRREILLGTLFGVLIGFNPGVGFLLLLTLLLTLLLNANFSFTVLGAAVGKLLSLFFAVISFHTGYFIIHDMGIEDLFRTLCNAPVFALMDLNVYAVIGSLPYALLVGLVLGTMLSSITTAIRKKMLEADQHEIVGKALNQKLARFLLWMAFGKNKLSLDDEVQRQTPWLRKSGLIIVACLIVISLALEFFLLDIVLANGLKKSISAVTGAEVDIAKADFSLATGKLAITGLQVTDPDKPTRNLVQIDKLVADVSMRDLLRKHYAIDLLEGSVMKTDVPRQSPGAVYVKPKKRKPKEAAPEKQPGKSLEDYFAQAKTWEKYGKKAYDFLKTHRTSATAEKGEQPKPSKKTAVADAERLGYLHAAANLIADRPTWIIHKLKIDNLELGADLPPQTLSAFELSSNPELYHKLTTATLITTNGAVRTAKLLLRFDNPSAQNALAIHLPGIEIGGKMETSSSFPVDITEGKADLNVDGLFSADKLNLPFKILVHGLKAKVEDGKKVLGMDAATATEVFSSMNQLEIDGTLEGSLLMPRVQIDYDKLAANMKKALVAAGKKELASKANAQVDKAKQELKKQAGKQVNKLLGGKEGESTTDKAKDALKKLF